jgi:hypothetical protein
MLKASITNSKASIGGWSGGRTGSHTPAFKGQPSTRITFAKKPAGPKASVWYSLEGDALTYLYVDIAPYDEGQDDPFFA